MRFILQLILIFAATIAQASDKFDDFFNNGGCFASHFSDTEMTGHPQMPVQYIALSRSLLFDPENSRVLNVFFSPRNTDQIFRSMANCSDAGGRLRCYLRADAGSFTLESDKNGGLTLSVGPDGMELGPNLKTKITVGNNVDNRFIYLSKADTWPCK